MIKKRQHYVYQKYLEPWTNKGQVWCLFNRTNANPVNTINIGQEKYFYQIKDFYKIIQKNQTMIKSWLK